MGTIGVMETGRRATSGTVEASLAAIGLILLALALPILALAWAARDAVPSSLLALILGAELAFLLLLGYHLLRCQEAGKAAPAPQEPAASPLPVEAAVIGRAVDPGEDRALAGEVSRVQDDEASAQSEIAAGLERLASSASDQAGHARQTSDLAREARSRGERSLEALSRTIGAMDEIAASSRKIATIIAVIDDIALQTNLLALNAAIEAARAGEHGRGFAVIAAEVQGLSSRSATSAKEIKKLVAKSLDDAKQGEASIEDSAVALSELNEAIKRLDALATELAATLQHGSREGQTVQDGLARLSRAFHRRIALARRQASRRPAEGRGTDYN